ncbi:gamma-glutamylcyclotransferase family protein [Pyrinomonas methylaliphatogenes]|jgi:gamma-glutamylcyclotransferase (GGCT)/AIG2-like uncharacterized protein YtfP|uniref:Gamma-glutamylcyclotransferase AIG2-like domain-containing protein n=1 Tax=Pyrinomonas methylaliphatogenes TaxID=454194 RepID=A0A0B6WXG8_9BACT|nr:gamma-glutamylcyclotransferase family protein [Pyrinomonas methylaliphatogenes]MBX5477853.1 gamma-glutamylcyclotransferase [Pyrinomonas methylaliphatogenes]CDM65776.1 hypothetical protein PYK22_01783 [Pyrinomonas methylaliphatogenes]
MKEHIFVYGTLRPECAPEEVKALIRGLSFVGQARVRGKLYDLGPYPGAVACDDESAEIRGDLFALPADRLRALDEYEGYDPRDERGSLFVRRRTIATLDDGQRIECWIYFYNGRVDAARLIPGGDYLDYLREKAGRR